MKWPPFMCVALIICTQAYNVASSIQATIPDSLIDCYRNQSLLLRENLLPNTLTSLLAILRKIESSPFVYMDMRTLASTLLTTYRLDGIEKNPQVMPSEYVVPYSPSGSQFYRYKILMEGLIPNSGLTIPNNTLTPVEKCSLHSMLSSSVDYWERGDEGTVCNNLMNNQIMNSRSPRAVNSKNLDSDAETFDLSQMEKGKKTNSNSHLGSFQSGVPRSNMNTYTDFTLSSCPIENGVIYTKYGAVKIGIVLAGIAAGLQSQTVSQSNLFRLAARGKTLRRPTVVMYTPTTGTTNVSNKWVATLSGILAELSLLQGPVNQQSMRVGLAGGWNDSLVPRYYFLTEQNKDALTDTDIRGAIDGLLMASYIQSWKNLVSDLKLSQVLDMYYSERGVFDKTVRSCQREEKFTTIAPSATMLAESVAFSEVLQLELPIAVNLAVEAIQDFNTLAVSKISTYVPNMAKKTCATLSSSTVITATPAVNLIIAIDFNYDYLVAEQILNYIVDNVEVSKYSSNVSIVNAKDASILVNSTQTPLDFHKNFTRENYTRGVKGFDLSKVIQEIGNILIRKLNYEKVSSTPGGPSTVVLIIPYSTASISETDKYYINSKLASFRNIIPDVTYIYLTTGSKERFSSFVVNTESDLFTLTLTDIAASINPLITRLTQVPRRIINPACTSNFYGPSSSNLLLYDYVEPQGIHYYRVHPNYFYKSTSGRIRIQGTSSAVLNVCTSRSILLPSPNSSSSGSTCSQITSGSYDININDQSCSGSDYGYQCQPIYFSVTASQPTATSTYYQCSDEGCRYPDNIKFSIVQDGLTCYSSSNLIKLSTHVLICSLVLSLFKLSFG